MRNLLICLFLPVCTLLLFQGCTQKKETVIELPNSFKSPAIEDWAVIQEPYTAFYEEPSEFSGIASNARRGDVLKVEGRKIVDKKHIWLKFERGWIQDSVVIIYSNELKARKAAAVLEN